jgi:glycosyltransferase involved in cell wall biosynthesis
MKPRVLLVGRTRYRLPLDATLRRKFDALGDVLDLRVVGSGVGEGPAADDTFRLVGPFRPRALDGVAFHATLPVRIARELRRFRPQAVLVQGAHEATGVLAARRLARSDAKVILDVHGDWRTATRLYGSPARKLLNPVADRLAAHAVRSADGVRTISDFTDALVREHGVEPAASFPAFMDLEPFLSEPVALPPEPAALFVGVLELYKNVDGLADAWRLAAPRVDGAKLRIVGRGPREDVVRALVRDLPGQVEWTERVPNADVPGLLDASTALVLPSRSEGMGRVVVEALLRGRPVVASRVGGIVDLVRDGENGLLAGPGDTRALADALVHVLTDRALAERLAGSARESVERWVATPEEYASRIRAVVDAVIAGGSGGANLD